MSSRSPHGPHHIVNGLDGLPQIGRTTPGQRQRFNRTHADVSDLSRSIAGAQFDHAQAGLQRQFFRAAEAGDNGGGQ